MICMRGPDKAERSETNLKLYKTLARALIWNSSGAGTLLKMTFGQLDEKPHLVYVIRRIVWDN